jgi:glycosyltransferase involved in cell wall biosynthesis
MTDKTVYINGKFLSQKMSGVQRYASEICKNLDSKITVAAAADHQDDAVYHLNKPLEVIGNKGGILWEQFTLPTSLRSKGSPLLISLCNAAPVFYPNKITCLHDIAFTLYPQYFSKKLVLYYRWLIPKVLNRSRHIITVSEFSKREISSYYHIDPAHISVVPNASTFSAYSTHPLPRVQERPYFLFVGSLDPRKNLITLLKAFRQAKREDADLIVVGAGHASFASNPAIDAYRTDSNIIFTGYISDEQLRAYYGGALALINPSFYEGFGLPVVEALSMNCPVLASSIDAFKEVGGTDIEYFNAADVSELSDLIKNFSGKALSETTSHVQRLTWKTSAALVDKIIQQFN